MQNTARWRAEGNPDLGSTREFCEKVALKLRPVVEEGDRQGWDGSGDQWRRETWGNKKAVGSEEEAGQGDVSWGPSRLGKDSGIVLLWFQRKLLASVAGKSLS